MIRILSHPTLRSAIVTGGLAMLCCGAALPQCQAQSAPGDTLTPQQMIEKLRQPPPADAAGPRTRSLRNLAVEAVPAAEQARAALSLQIQFDFNSSQVKPESHKALSNLAQALQSADLAGAKFAIEGHTDAKGRTDYNLQLSQQRADAVKAILMREGVQTTRLAAIGKGSTDPANPGNPLAAENRRVRVVNLESP